MSRYSLYQFFCPLSHLFLYSLYQYLATYCYFFLKIGLSIFNQKTSICIIILSINIRHILLFLPKIGSLLYQLSPYSLYFEYFYFFPKIGCALFLSYVPLFSINIVSPFFLQIWAFVMNFTTHIWPINNLG